MSADDYAAYLAPVVGTRIIAVQEENTSVFLFFDDGCVLEFYAEPDGGFSAELHQPRQVH